MSPKMSACDLCFLVDTFHTASMQLHGLGLCKEDGLCEFEPNSRYTVIGHDDVDASAKQKRGKEGKDGEEDVALVSTAAGVGTNGSFIFRHFLHRDAKLSKMITRQDPHHLHKTLGVLAVLR